MSEEQPQEQPEAQTQEQPEQPSQEPDQETTPEEQAEQADSPPVPALTGEELDANREEEQRIHSERTGGGEVHEGELQRERGEHDKRTDGDSDEEEPDEGGSGIS